MTDLLDKAADCFTAARKNIYDGAKYLYEINETNAWEGRYSSFSEYVEQECQISKGFASKLLQVWKFYVIDRGATPRSIEGVDAEKLYLATKLPQDDKRSSTDLITIAREWNREDFRAAITPAVDNCDHPPECRVTLCTQCHSRVE